MQHLKGEGSRSRHHPKCAPSRLFHTPNSSWTVRRGLDESKLPCKQRRVGDDEELLSQDNAAPRDTWNVRCRSRKCNKQSWQSRFVQTEVEWCLSTARTFIVTCVAWSKTCRRRRGYSMNTVRSHLLLKHLGEDHTPTSKIIVSKLDSSESKCVYLR